MTDDEINDNLFDVTRGGYTPDYAVLRLFPKQEDNERENVPEDITGKWVDKNFLPESLVNEIGHILAPNNNLIWFVPTGEILFSNLGAGEVYQLEYVDAT